MKKRVICVILAAALMMGTMPAYANIADENVVWMGEMNTDTGEINVLVDKTTPTVTGAALPNNAVRVVVDNKELTATGVIIDGRTLIPLRALGEALGAKVNWDASKQEIRIEKMLYQSSSKGVVTDSNRVILMHIGNKEILKNGTVEQLDVAPQIINGSTMVPVKAVTDFLEATATWDGATRTVRVDKKDKISIEGDKKPIASSQNIDFSSKPNDVSYDKFLLDYGIGTEWTEWTEDTFVYMLNTINGGEYNKIILPKIQSFGNYNDDMKITKLTDNVAVGVQIDNNTGLIKAATTAISTSNCDYLDALTFSMYTASILYLSNDNFSVQEVYDILNDLIEDLTESKKQTVIKYGIYIRATYNADLKQFQIVIVPQE